MINLKRLLPLHVYFELCSPIHLMLNALGIIHNVRVESFFGQNQQRLYFRGIEWASNQAETFIIPENDSEIEYECRKFQMCIRSEFVAKAEIVSLVNPVGLIPSIKKIFFTGVAFWDNNRMVYTHHTIGNVHINLLVLAGDLEGLQKTTLRPTVFELILVRIENQTLLMAAPVNPDHVRF